MDTQELDRKVAVALGLSWFVLALVAYFYTKDVAAGVGCLIMSKMFLDK